MNKITINYKAIDRDIRKVIRLLNTIKNIKTLQSCSGHKDRPRLASKSKKKFKPLGFIITSQNSSNELRLIKKFFRNQNFEVKYYKGKHGVPCEYHRNANWFKYYFKPSENIPLFWRDIEQKLKMFIKENNLR